MSKILKGGCLVGCLTAITPKPPEGGFNTRKAGLFKPPSGGLGVKPEGKFARFDIHSLVCAGMLAIIFSLSFAPLPPGNKLTIHFENYVGDRKLYLDTATYKNAIGESYTVTNFKYYVSNIRLLSTGGRDYLCPDGYYLIRQDEEGTWTAELNDIPDGSYSGISFMIGVDSLHNCSGAQSGALDPINGMFWTWNMGYIFLKLEGKSASSKSPGHIFEYHIGGYKEPNNFIRSASISFGKDLLNMTNNAGRSLFIKADAAKVLSGSNAIDFSKLSSVTDFRNAALIADNYRDMFSFIRVGNE